MGSRLSVGRWQDKPGRCLLLAMPNAGQVLVLRVGDVEDLVVMAAAECTHATPLTHADDAYPNPSP